MSTSADIRTGEYPVIYVGGPMAEPTGFHYAVLSPVTVAGDKLSHVLGFKFADGASSIDITTGDSLDYTENVPGRSEGKGTIDLLACKPGTDAVLDAILDPDADPVAVYFYNDSRVDTADLAVRGWLCRFTSDYNSGGQKGAATRTLTVYRTGDAPVIALVANTP